MAARPSWDGFLKFNLISVPVKAYTANVTGADKTAFHMIHKDCNSRIRYKKVCPVHGEVNKDEIVSGYEYSKGSYVIVDPAELDKLRTENERAISIDSFIHPEDVDPAYFNGRTYYLVPDGRVAQKPYAVLREVMAKEQRYGIARLVLSGREQITVVRAMDNLLVLNLLNYSDQIKQPTSFEEDLSEPEVSAAERKLAETLVETSTEDDFNLSRYKDEYTSKLRKLIEAKAKGKKIVAPPTEEEPVVINLMDALRKSLDRARKESGGNGTHHARAGRKAPSGGRRTAHAARRRKTG